MTPRKESPAAFQPRPSALATLVALGVASALLALFLWSELLLARAGGSTLCGLGDPGSCARLWDGAVAAGVHRATGVPIAGWGLVWALAATALPLLALMRAAAGRPQTAWLTAVRLTAAGGVTGVFALAAVAAQAQICVEGRAGSPAYASALFSRQDALTVDEVYDLAAELMPRSALEACVRSAATAIKLRADIDLAVRYQLDGTPLVLLNGRKGTSFPPFLYAMALAGGRADHPAFASLPPANRNAHIH